MVERVALFTHLSLSLSLSPQDFLYLLELQNTAELDSSAVHVIRVLRRCESDDGHSCHDGGWGVSERGNLFVICF